MIPGRPSVFFRRQLCHILGHVSRGMKIQFVFLLWYYLYNVSGYSSK